MLFYSNIDLRKISNNALMEYYKMGWKALITAGKLFRNRNFILILSLVLGLAIGKPGAYWTQPMVIPLLALVMTISALNISFRQFASVQNVSRIVLYSLLLNYVILARALSTTFW